MTKLLWLCTIALGHRMLWEQSYHLRFGKMVTLQRVLRWVSVGWVGYLLYVALWFWNHP